MNRKLKRIFVGAALAIAFLASAGEVSSQSSANYDLHWNLLSGGGGRRTSTSVVLHDSVGESFPGVSQSSGYRLQAGFWAGAGNEFLGLFLPAVRK